MNKTELIAAVAEAADGMILQFRHFMGDKCYSEFIVNRETRWRSKQ